MDGTEEIDEERDTATPIPFDFPNIDEHAAAAPTDRDSNPHLRNTPARPEAQLGGPDDFVASATPKYQHSEGHWEPPVIGSYLCLANVPDNLRAQITKDPDSHLLAVIFCGGSAFRSHITDAHERVKAALADDVPPGSIQPIPVQPKDSNYGRGADNVYASPFIVLLRITNRARLPLIRQRLLGIATVPVSEEDGFAFHIIAADDPTISWTTGIYTCGSEPSTPDLEKEISHSLRAAVTEEIWRNEKLARKIDRLTQGSGRGLRERLYEVSRSVHPVWNPLMKAWVVYIRPCTTRPEAWEDFVNELRKLDLDYGYYAFASIVKKPRLGPLCTICKLTNHLHFGCSFAKGSRVFWGPRSQIKDMKTGPLARNNKRDGGGGANTSNRDQGGFNPPRGGYRGGRGGFAGRGRG
ncbi:hypothetical protein R3P38DRAFT_2512720 [Favolaschia claudopus]|uniref:Uncharacterized protein n=1 Tax=Favolaschia claudopus TaxID=2862362 RepID=A0AAW0CN08_9AGAR